MSMLLLMGIVFTIVPLVLILGFSLVIFFSFMRDDPIAQAAFNVALLFLFVGLAMIGIHLGGQYFG